MSEAFNLQLVMKVNNQYGFDLKQVFLASRNVLYNIQAHILNLSVVSDTVTIGWKIILINRIQFQMYFKSSFELEEVDSYIRHLLEHVNIVALSKVALSFHAKQKLHQPPSLGYNIICSK